MDEFRNDSGELILKSLFKSKAAFFLEFEAGNDFSLLFISKNVQKICGFEQQEFLKNKDLWISRIHPDDISNVKACFREKIYLNKTIRLEYRFRHKNDKYIWLCDEIHIEHDDERERGIIVDISIPAKKEKPDVEKELEFLKSAIEHIKDAVVIVGVESNDEHGPEIKYANKAYEKLTGSKRDEILGGTFRFLHGPKTDYDTLKRIYDSALQYEPFHEELINYNKKGKPYWVEVSMAPVKNMMGEYAYWVGIHRDISERKKTEEQLANNEKKYRTLFDLSFDAIIQMSLEWKIQDVNQSACRIFGYSRDEFLQMTMLDLMPDEIAEKQGAFYSENLLTGDSIIKTLKKRKDGSLFAVEVSTQMIDIGGEKQVIAYVRDVSDKEKIIKDLIESKNSLAKAQSMARMGNWEYNFVNKEFFWSDELFNMAGVDKEKYKPTWESFKSIIHTDDIDSFIEAIKKMLKSGKKLDFVYRAIDTKGNEYIIRSIGEATFDTNGLAVKIAGTSQDITEQEQAKQQLQLLTTAVEAADNGIVIVDRNGKIVWVNHAFTKLTGYSEKEAIGRNPRLLNSGKQDKKFYSNLWNTILSGHTWNGQIINRRKEGSLYVEEMSITPFTKTNGEITHFIAIKRDITEKRKYHIRLEESLREKEVLLAEVHHRVKNNLAMISGLLYLQLNNIKDKSAKKILSLSQSRIQSIALIHELLYRSSTLSTIHFNEFIERLVHYLGEIYQDVKCDICVNVQAADIVLNVNQAIPSALLINEIVINAYEHAFEGKKSGVINIQSKLIDDKVHIEVSDNGIGLPRAYNEMMTNTLGLKLIETLSKQLSAELTNENHPGNGTTFEVRYKLKKEQEPVRLF